ncbi:MAG: divalent-cation tolerance protein CutA [Chloroflexi bacterium]|nr:divalent-cation tolerance protein CutA [Chloroflexota bacterium]
MILIYVVCANADEARRISRHLLEQRLGACTNLFPIESAYWWEGKIVEDKETGLIVKTVPENFEKVKQAVQKLHSYQAPCIIAVDVAKVEDKYLAWLRSEVR